MRYVLLILVLLSAAVLLLRSKLYTRSGDLPVFLSPDPIAETHKTLIDVKVHSMYKPDSASIVTLKKDYSALWGHLNHLFNTNDVETGKEYYTENWFKQVCNHDNTEFETGLIREDISHELHIMNWSSDYLVCAAIDSNVVFRYHSEGIKSFERKINMAVVLLYQGDHWRIDAIKQLKEEKI